MEQLGQFEILVNPPPNQAQKAAERTSKARLAAMYPFSALAAPRQPGVVFFFPSTVTIRRMSPKALDTWQSENKLALNQLVTHFTLDPSCFSLC